MPPARSGAERRPRTLTVARGTPVNVKLEEPLSTEQAKKGKLFHASLASPIVTDGFVVAQAGSGVTGKVLESRRAGVFGRRPELQLVLLDIQATDKQVVPVQTGTWDDTGRAHNPLESTMRSAVGAVSGAVTGAARGSGMMPEQCDRCESSSRIIMLPANTTLQFRLVAPVLVTERKH